VVSGKGMMVPVILAWHHAWHAGLTTCRVSAAELGKLASMIAYRHY